MEGVDSSCDANAKVLRVRALLKRGGKTPTYNTIVRTESVVATSAELQKLAASVGPAHDTIAEKLKNGDLKRTVYAVSAVRRSIGESYGLGEHSHSVPSTDVAPVLDSAWPPPYAVDACGQMSVHAARLEALCHSFAIKHRKEPNAENDVGHAICDTVAHLQETFAQLDDEVFKHGEHEYNLEVAARVLNRRARQLAARAKLDAHGEVFASIEFSATCSSLLRAASAFNAIHIGHTLYSGVPHHSGLDDFTSGMVAMESHALLADTLKHAGMQECAITNTLARAGRHAELAEAIWGVEDARDPLEDARVNTSAGQPLSLGEWASEGMRTGVAQFDVIGGFSISVEGDLTVHAESLDDCEWLCLRARTSTPIAAPLQPGEISRVAATAAWRRMRYDAGTYDAPFFRPTEDQLRAASRIGIALCGRGNLTNEYYTDSDVLVVDVGIAPDTLGMLVVGNHVPARATLHKAEDAIGYMFSELELDLANEQIEHAQSCDQKTFLTNIRDAEPASWTPDAPRVETQPTDAVQLVTVPLETVPETVVNAHEAFEKALHSYCNVRAASVVEQPARRKAADETSAALSWALCATIRESPCALNDLAARITRNAQPAATQALAPSVALYQQLAHKGERAVDVAASMVGLRDLEPIVSLPELEEVLQAPDTEDAVETDAAFEEVMHPESVVEQADGSGTPSSEEFDDLA